MRFRKLILVESRLDLFFFRVLLYKYFEEQNLFDESILTHRFLINSCFFKFLTFQNETTLTATTARIFQFSVIKEVTSLACFFDMENDKALRNLLVCNFFITFQYVGRVGRTKSLRRARISGRVYFVLEKTLNLQIFC